jgi:hypothetical protein
MILDVYSRSGMPDPRSGFLTSRIPDPGVKIAPDPRSATLVTRLVIREYIVIGMVWQPVSLQGPNQSGSRVVEPSTGLFQILMRNFLARSSWSIFVLMIKEFELATSSHLLIRSRTIHRQGKGMAWFLVWYGFIWFVFFLTDSKKRDIAGWSWRRNHEVKHVSWP